MSTSLQPSAPPVASCRSPLRRLAPRAGAPDGGERRRSEYTSGTNPPNAPARGLTGGDGAGPRRASSAWCRPALLPVLALLLGALGLFAAAPAQAQSHIWSATLTVDDIDDDGAYLGCDTSTCSSQLTEDELEHNGERYTVAHLYYNNGRVSMQIRGVQGPRPCPTCPPRLPRTQIRSLPGWCCISALRG